MSKSFSAVDFAYRTVVGRCILKMIMTLHLDRIAVRFLWSSWSKPLVSWYIKKNNIILTPEEDKPYSSFRDFFVRTRKPFEVDLTPEHLISPCDSLLSAFPIDEHSRFAIKSSTYQLKDFLQDESLAKNYHNGTCLIFRLCASDYHHYSYIDNGVQGENHHISGVLHSVQPIACEKYPVYVLNKRCWCLLETENFGPVIQCEIGALVVGGITNLKEKGSFRKGEEKGNFELAGSTIVLLFEKDKIELKPELQEKLKDGQEVRILQGEWIGMAK